MHEAVAEFNRKRMPDQDHPYLTGIHKPMDGELTLEARCMRRGARIAFCEGEVKDVAGTVVCVARAAFKLVPMTPGGN